MTLLVHKYLICYFLGLGCLKSLSTIFRVQGRNYNWGRRGNCLVWFSENGTWNQEKKHRERERERERAPTQLQLVWFIDHDTLSWLFVHFKSLLSVLETVQSKYKGQAAADASSYIKLCYSKSILSWLQLC